MLSYVEELMPLFPPPPHLSNKPLVSTKPPSNGLEINKPPPGGGGLIEDLQ